MATSVWKGHLTFGLVSIPIKLYRAARPEKVSFRQLRRTWTTPVKSVAAPSSPAAASARLQPNDRPAGLNSAAGKAGTGAREPVPMPAVEMVSRVRQHAVSDSDETPVERSQIVKGYEYEKDKYVVLEKEELRALTPETDRTMEISEFVKLDEIDPVYFESSYYAAPDEAGVKAYSLLYKALRQSGFVAIAEFAMHRRNHVVVLRPGNRGILLHTMFYKSEIRSQDEFASDDSQVSDREIKMAESLIKAMATGFSPDKFRDKYKEQLEALIQAKAEGRSVPLTETPKTKAPVDIVKALQSSLELVRKPVASAEAVHSIASPRKKRGQS